MTRVGGARGGIRLGGEGVKLSKVSRYRRSRELRHGDSDLVDGSPMALPFTSLTTTLCFLSGNFRAFGTVCLVAVSFLFFFSM